MYLFAVIQKVSASVLSTADFLKFSKNAEKWF